MEYGIELLSSRVGMKLISYGDDGLKSPAESHELVADDLTTPTFGVFYDFNSRFDFIIDVHMNANNFLLLNLRHSK